MSARGRRWLGAATIALALALLPAAASATVLVNAPAPFVKSCGSTIELGIWRRDDGQANPRTVTMSIRTSGGRLLWHKRARPTSRWRFWHYRPSCGRRYVVRYTSSLWKESWRVRVRR